jgi:hypothetical protein
MTNDGIIHKYETNTDDMVKLGSYYRCTKNYVKMKKYYLMAIENGNTDSMYYLGCYYDKINNYKEMEKYYLMAIENGNTDAMDLLERYYGNKIVEFYLKLLNLQMNEIIKNKINYLLKKYNYLHPPPPILK